MDEVLKYSIENVIKKLAKKEISSVDLVSSYIEQSKNNKKLNLYITETFDNALEEAKKSDERRQKNQLKGVLDGIPIANKDIFLTKGIRTTNGSNFLSNFIAPYESTVTQNLKNAGAISLGKLNMDEFAMGSLSNTSPYGIVISPHRGLDNKDKVAGGSSGGSASAVASNSVMAATGTDTGGSIRQPAAFTGVVGMKPTYGVCSRYGIISFASSLDQAGPLTKTVKDNALMLNAMAGYDSHDSTMLPFEKPDYTKDIGKSLKGIKIGIPAEYQDDMIKPDMQKLYNEAKQKLEDAGAQLVDVSLPNTKKALLVYFVISPIEAVSNFARFDGIRYGNQAKAESLMDLYKKSRSSGWGAEVKRRLLLGAYNSMDEHIHNYEKAAKVRRLVANDFITIFKEVDAILTLTAATEAFSVDELDKLDPIQVYLNDLFTTPANMAGLPAISIPAGMSNNNMPVGVQIIADRYNDALVYQVAHQLEQAGENNNL